MQVVMLVVNPLNVSWKFTSDGCPSRLKTAISYVLPIFKPRGRVRVRQSQVPPAQVALNASLLTGSMALAPVQGTRSPTAKPAGITGHMVWPGGFVHGR